MPKRIDIKNIMILGSGPIVIGQACEFDYSGTQACKALKEEGYNLILVNSNPATIMTDPDISDITYIEPMNWKIIAKIIEKEKPDVILPTMGGQTALNCIIDLHKNKILDKFNVEIIGVSIETINKAENRNYFSNIIKKLGFNVPYSSIVHNLDEAINNIKKIGFPCIIRPSFTMGGSGGGIANNIKEFKKICKNGFNLSPNHELIIDESLIGWKEYEMEIIRDQNGNSIIVCSIENIDPMGIHTGDSITVAPAQTLSDKEYQIMRNASISIMKAMDIKSGGANVQFAVNPKTGKLMVIEMNPRVSRSSALASKATGFPIAKISAKLSIGYTLDELINDITSNHITASFEPSIDYIVIKIPRFNFEKFHNVNDRLTTQMKSVGEVMSIGRSFQESIQKALCSLEIGINGFDPKINLFKNEKNYNLIIKELKKPGPDRIRFIADAMRVGISIEDIYNYSKIDKWFLIQIENLINIENRLKKKDIKYLYNKQCFFNLKKKGFSDARLANLFNTSEEKIRKLRYKLDIHPVYKRVDTCSAEFQTNTAYIYSTYETECEANPNNNKNKIIILGSGPNRIGQGIEFDYCCVHASMILRKNNFETIMINCNPETVSTDYDISDRLYFEPITLESILEIIRIENPQGVIIQYGGQTPLNLAKELEKENINILGTSSSSIDLAENRKKFQYIINSLDLKQSVNYMVKNLSEALEKSKKIGFPIIVRPSYVLGGRSMEVIYNKNDLKNYYLLNIKNNIPVLLEKFLENAIEVDVDAICDQKNIFIGGIMEHIEYLGIHSGDSACSFPTRTLSKKILEKIKIQTKKLAIKINVCGLINIQFAIKNNKIYIIEVNPRASRTIPFISKAINIPLAKMGALVMLGRTLSDLNLDEEIIPPYFSVKEVMLPFNKFDNIDPILGPEMKSTGEVMGIGFSFAEAFYKAILGTKFYIRKYGTILVSVQNKDKKLIFPIVQKLIDYGFKIEATYGTAKFLRKLNLLVKIVRKSTEKKPNIIDFIKNKKYSYIINIVEKKESIENSKLIRIVALQNNIYYNTTINGAKASLVSIGKNFKKRVFSLQELHQILPKNNFNI
ncbi:carbamoyl-phosphate synthase large subunit [Enterobacteriaceae endosymbiont of Donacia bicoloricornis]|uniref:carbamoyl-phosphate synthase large subunit n=1 Tax=Enterobacteriaceae endosymbiont of Donacia bicoloricornis TaxID=2675772 RepID=UPI001448A5AB|nr:carbamoyl-phosphate synthase large subunit [Enterobacteriaceae endosymbiont of Donacia bicoloricornis]QJC37714.1 carbamoyl-phosphate synthase large subunit [Enterobacteriaceae endosymbiont of Donacia bicoloricornis]